MNRFKNILFIVIGTLMVDFGVAVFIIPFELVSGGVAGLAIITDKILPGEFFSIDMVITVFTWGLFFVGLFFLGRNFAVKTFLSTVIYPVGISVFMKLVSPDVLNGIFYLKGSGYAEVSLVLAAIFGGVFMGAGCAVTFLGGGSTGGVDIIAFILCKFFKKLRHSVVMFVIDAVIIVLGMFVIDDMVISLLGITSAFIGASVIDKIFLGESKAFIAQIVSGRYEEINRLVIKRLKRTTSLVDIIGGYSKEKKKMVLVSFTMNQYSEIINIINSVDKNAFITVQRAHEINGEGWTR